MSDAYFPICGTTVPEMIGRTELLGLLVADLTKHTPSHKAILGSRFAGKTVLLHALAEHPSVKERFSKTIIWDLGHNTPVSNDSFLFQLAGHIGRAFPEDYKAFLDGSEEIYQDLKEVLELLGESGHSILMLWDGFDKPLKSGALTRNLWDQLRELASIPSFRLVTATRKPMQELLRDEDSTTSDFWNIFDPSPVRVSVMTNADYDAVLAKMPNYHFEQSARSELANWTGGNFVLSLGLLNAMAALKSEGPVSNTDINAAAEQALENELEPYITQLWRDCSEEEKDLCHQLISGDMTTAQAPHAQRSALEHAGFADCSGNRVKSSCRLLRRHIELHGHCNGNITRLFASEDDYSNNI